ncbi:MAG: biotin transporter BioY [Treponema sp.]|nr:biotin transporter BioY [Treponema sp.]
MNVFLGNGEAKEAAQGRAFLPAKRQVKRMGVFTALFAALICLSSFWTVPLIPGIPIVMKNLVIVLSGVLLGTWYGAAAAALFLLAGVLGLPVFANAGGIAAFLSPAGGYMIGYVLGALAAGFVAGTPKIQDKKPGFLYSLRIAAALFLGFAIILLCGAFQLMYLNSRLETPRGMLSVFLGGIIPFVPADSIKFVLSLPLALALRPVAARYINPAG